MFSRMQQIQPKTQCTHRLDWCPWFWWEGGKFDSRDLSTGQNTHCDTD